MSTQVKIEPMTPRLFRHIYLLYYNFASCFEIQFHTFKLVAPRNQFDDRLDYANPSNVLETTVSHILKIMLSFLYQSQIKVSG